MNNLNNFKMRADYANNDRQHNRMVEGKLKSLYRALLYSYQAAWIRKDYTDDNYVRALINPDKIKFDYDEKIVSVEFEYEFHPGDSFEWPKNSGIHWIIYKQEVTELAYFRGNVRKCQLLEVKDPETKETESIWAAVRGPVETKINSIQKAGIVADVPNLSLEIYMMRTDKNIRLFSRYERFNFMNRTWKVNATDDISTSGILQVMAVEDYDCEHDNLIIDVVDPNPSTDNVEYKITGNTFTKPLNENNYTVNSIEDSKWTITLPAIKNKEIDDVLQYTVKEDNSIDVKWIAMISGSFILHYGSLEKTVVVESLF